MHKQTALIELTEMELSDLIAEATKRGAAQAFDATFLRFVGAEEVARILGMSLSWVRHNGDRLHAQKFGGSVRYPLWGLAAIRADKQGANAR